MDARVEPRPTINDLVNEALTRWVDLTGIVFDDGGQIKEHAKNCPWGSYELGNLTAELNDSRSLDPTGLTTFMMLRGMVESYLREIKYDAERLILRADSIESELVPMRGVRNVLENPDVLQLIGDFQQTLRDAAAHYGVPSGKPTDALEELLQDKYSLAIIRRDAFLSARRLEAHQFSQGAADPNPPKYTPHVYEFWNINSLLAAMRSQKFGGISVVLIRDPEEPLHSYFIFAIKNGYTFTILTDRTKESHPGSRRRTRRPDRGLDARRAQNWFPYDLLDLKAIKDEDGDVTRLVANERTQIVLINVEAVPIKAIHELGPEEFVWTILMFDLLRDKFWKENARLPELSFTGQMVVEPHALVGANGSLFKEGLYRPLEVPVLTRADVTAESTADQWLTEPTRFNAWMVERYGHLVPDEILSPVGRAAGLLLDQKADVLLPVTTTEEVVNVHGEQRKEAVHFDTLDPTSFGTADDIKRDRLWVARVNQMKAIQRFADREFEREREAMLAWYMNAVRDNQEALLNACARGELELTAWVSKDGSSFEGKEKVRAPALRQGEGATWFKAHNYYGFRRPPNVLGRIVSEEVQGRGWRRRTRTVHHQMCVERPNIRATIFTAIRVTCPEALAVVCNVALSELPWALQHWYTEAPYHGNPGLSRLDPEDWVLKNPWMPDGWRSTGLKLDIGIAQCKNAFNARRKALGLPPKDWEAEREKNKDS